MTIASVNTIYFIAISLYIFQHLENWKIVANELDEIQKFYIEKPGIRKIKLQKHCTFLVEYHIKLLRFYFQFYR